MAVVGTTCDLRSGMYSQNVSRGGSQRVHFLGKDKYFLGGDPTYVWRDDM